MQNGKFNTGAFVFTRTRGLAPRDPADVIPLAASHGFDPSLIPPYPGDRVSITRAITQATAGLSAKGFLLRPIKRTSSEVVFGIVKEQKDEAQVRLDHDFEATVSWSAEPDPSVVTGDHEVARRVRDAYALLRGKIVSDDWSASITSYLESHDAARMRGDGRVYWVPPQRLDDVKRLGAFLSEVGIDLILCEIEPETRTVVKDVARVSLDEELDRLQAEADAFDGTQKPSTYSRRLDEYQQLRQRAILYRDALGIGADRAKAVLDELEQKVSGMLSIRRQTVIHRDGSKGGVSSSPAPSTGDTLASPSRITFAGAAFVLKDLMDDVLTYTSDDAAAKNSVAMLESMGLAGKWQQAGSLKLSIQNSGPPGAAVSLRFQLPPDQTI
jgi:hypothetical protein